MAGTSFAIAELTANPRRAFAEPETQTETADRTRAFGICNPSVSLGRVISRAMESFIVRIYQRSSAENVIGTVELVGKRCEKTFHNMNELISILSSPRLRRTKAAAPLAVKGTQPKGGLS